MSTGGGTTTQNTVQKSDPWGPSQPYLTDLMSQAQNLYNTSSQDTSYAPFNTVAPLSDQTQAALNATYQRAMNGSPLIGGADQALTGLMQPQMAPGMAALQGLAGGYADPGNAYLHAAAGANPYATPAAGYLGAEASPGFINPYLTAQFNMAAKPVVDQINAQFSAAGRTGSTANQNALMGGLGSLATNIYGNGFNQAAQLQQNAAAQIQNAYDAAAARGLTAGSQLSANALNQANVMANAAAGLNSQFNSGNNLTLNAAQFAPSLAGQDYTDLQNALSVGGAYDQQAQNRINDMLTRWQYQQQQPWNLLDNYSGLVTGYAGLGGTVNSNQTKTTPGQSLIPSLIGGAIQAAPFFLSSDRALKTDICRIGSYPNGLPKYLFRYKGDPCRWIGLMAQDVLKVKPQAVARMTNGYLAVNYPLALSA